MRNVPLEWVHGIKLHNTRKRRWEVVSELSGRDEGMERGSEGGREGGRERGSEGGRGGVLLKGENTKSDSQELEHRDAYMHARIPLVMHTWTNIHVGVCARESV